MVTHVQALLGTASQPVLGPLGFEDTGEATCTCDSPYECAYIMLMHNV